MPLAERLMEKGMKKGEFKKAKEIAKEFLINKIDIELVAKYTKLSKEEVQKLKDEM